MVVAQKRKKKKREAPSAFVKYRESAESAEANSDFPLMIDLDPIPDSFQHEAFCSLFKAITRVNSLIRSVGATFRTRGDRFA
jgi:hypothetical protein